MPKITNTKLTLPEISSNDKDLIYAAREALKNKLKAAEHTSAEKGFRKEMEKKGTDIYNTEFDKGNPIGLIRVIDSEVSSARIEMRINNGALDVSEKNNLRKLLGHRKTQLFERTRIITDITDPAAILTTLTKKGLDPWKYVEIKVKENMDEVIWDAIDGKHCQSAEAYLPKQGFLSKLNQIFNTLSDGAKKYLKEYLANALKPTAVIGSK